MATATKTVEVHSKIPVYLPLLPDEGGADKVDQRVVVTVNGTNIIIPRGETVEVTPAVYEVLHNSGRFERV